MTTTDVVLSLLAFAGVCDLAFVLIYAGRPWRTTLAGQALMVSMASKVLIAVSSVVSWATPTYAAEPVVRIGAMVLFTLAQVGLLAVLLLARDMSDQERDAN